MCIRCRRRRRRRPRPRCRFSHPSLLHAACSPVARHAPLVIKFDVVSSLSLCLSFFSRFFSFSFLSRETRSVQPPPPSSPNLVGGCHGVRTCVCDLVASPARPPSLSFSRSVITVSPPPLSPSSTDRRTGRPHREPHQSPAERPHGSANPGECQKLYNIAAARSNARSVSASPSPSCSP